MRFSFWTGNGQSWEDTLEGCHYAEKTGWDGIWYADHFMPNEENIDQKSFTIPSQKLLKLL